MVEAVGARGSSRTPESHQRPLCVARKTGLGVDLNEALIAAHPPVKRFMDFRKKGWEKRIAISKLSENDHEFNTPGR